MLIIAATIGPSTIHGTGVFAAEPIKKGQVIWILHKGFDQTYTKEQLDQLPKKVYENALKSYIYWSPILQRYIFCADQARFYNHAEDCNCKGSTWDEISEEEREKLRREYNNLDNIEYKEGFTIAAKDIAVGDELTSNYLEEFPERKEELFPFL